MQRELQSDVRKSLSGSQGSLETRVGGRCGFQVWKREWGAGVIPGVYVQGHLRWLGVWFSRELVSALADLYSLSMGHK